SACVSSLICRCLLSSFFSFNDPATTEIYTLSLHDALPIYRQESDVVVPHLDRALENGVAGRDGDAVGRHDVRDGFHGHPPFRRRSEEHTSELQSRENLVCRLLLEKKKKEPKSDIGH